MFECHLVTCMQLSLAVSAARLLRDRRIIFWACCLPSMFVASFVDAYPSKFRSAFTKLFFTGMALILLFWQGILVFGWATPIHDSKWQFFHIEGHISSSTAATLVTQICFCCRHIYGAFFNPDHFVVLVSEIRTVKETVHEELKEVDGTLTATGQLLRHQRTSNMRLSQRDLDVDQYVDKVDQYVDKGNGIEFDFIADACLADDDTWEPDAEKENQKHQESEAETENSNIFEVAPPVCRLEHIRCRQQVTPIVGVGGPTQCREVKQPCNDSPLP